MIKKETIITLLIISLFSLLVLQLYNQYQFKKIIDLNIELYKLKDQNRILDKEIEKLIQEEEQKEENKLIKEIAEWIYESTQHVPLELAEEMAQFTIDNCEYPKAVLAIIKEESKFNMFAHRSDTKVYGLGQIHYKSWKEELKDFGVEKSRDLFDWKKNILAVDYIYGKYRKQNKNINNTLKRYVGEKNNPKPIYRKQVVKNISVLTQIENKYKNS